MKTLYFAIILFFICSSLNAQNYYKSQKFEMSFTSYEDLEYYADKLYPNEGTYTSENYDIFISKIILNQYLDDIEKVSYLYANEYGLKNIENKGDIPNLKNSHYISANNFENGIEISFYIISIYKPYIDVLYNIIITGYNLNETEGERLVNSFRTIR